MPLRQPYLALTSVFAAIRLLPMGDTDKDIEILTLRHQLAILQRHAGKPRLIPADRALLAALLHRLPRPRLRQLHLIVARTRSCARSELGWLGWLGWRSGGRATMRTVLRVAVMIALSPGAACTGRVDPAVSPSGRVPAASGGGAAPPGQVDLDCSDPIDMVSSPTGPQRGILDVVGLDITSTLQVARAAGAPHRLFAKTGLLIHAGREGSLTVPASWATRLSIAWGNHAPEWTTGLHIPACPAPPAASGRWLVFPGGFSLDKAACVPLQVRAGRETTTVHVSVGTHCRG